MDKGTYVSRSTYQKVVEENKKLKRDIKILTVDWDSGTTREQYDEYFDTVARWQEHFRMEDQFRQDLIEILQMGRNAENRTQENHSDTEN